MIFWIQSHNSLLLHRFRNPMNSFAAIDFETTYNERTNVSSGGYLTISSTLQRPAASTLSTTTMLCPMLSPALDCKRNIIK
jgi:hypothetical protein